MPELRSETPFAIIDPPADILPLGAAVTQELAKQLFDRQRDAVGDAVALAARHIRAAHPTVEVHAKMYGPRSLLTAVGHRDDKRTGYAAGHAQCWPGMTRLVEGNVIVTWAGEVIIRWRGIAPPGE